MCACLGTDNRAETDAMRFIRDFQYTSFTFFFVRKQTREYYHNAQDSLSFFHFCITKIKKIGNDAYYLLKFSIFFFVIFLSACGIQGYPISPSEAQLPKKNESLFPLEAESQADLTQPPPTKSYIDTGTLFQAGGFYSAGFGLENDTLDDVFERLKPKSARPKGRIVTPLNR